MNHYNTQQILEDIEAFKTRMKDYDGERVIYFDQDNTLYRFSMYQQVDTALSQCYTKGFYKNLPIFQEAPEVISALQRMNLRCKILTSLVDSPFCNDEKLESIHYYFPMIRDEDIILVPYGEKKVDKVNDVKHSILVDDYHKNINDWYLSGGVAIKKSYSGKPRPVPVVSNLIELFPVLKELNFI